MSADLAKLDWPAIEVQLAERGFARTAPVLSPSQCDELIELYADPKRFRKRVDMERHRFGCGDYAYFTRPLPRLVQSLRTQLYRRLRSSANHFARELRWRWDYPPTLSAFLKRCEQAGQTLATPLLLHYEAGGYNRMHQDFYGKVYFPLQVTIPLSRRGGDYQGGEMLLLEQRPRLQARAQVVDPERGELVIFSSGPRPVEGKRGSSRLIMRHGVATVTSGERYALGLIFHDAKS